MTEDIKIYIATHKSFTPPKNDIYIPLQVGAEGKKDLGYLKDNTGDNISSMNPYYCELTGMYWMWKNTSADIIGLVHYRRYFYDKYIFSKPKEILDKKAIQNMMSKYDVIVAQRGYTWFNKVGPRYGKYLPEGKSDMKITEEAVKIVTPEYANAFDTVMNSNHYSQFNMMICRKAVFDAYCEWLFAVLKYVEEHLEIPLSEREAYNARVFGFLSERLLNVWLVKHSELKVKELPVLNTEESIGKQKLESCFKKVLKGVL